MVNLPLVDSCLLRLLLLQLLLLPPRFGVEHILDCFGAAEEQPRSEEYNGEIEAAEREENTVISPLVRVKDVETSRKFISIPVLAEFTDAVHASLYISSSLGNELLRI